MSIAEPTDAEWCAALKRAIMSGVKQITVGGKTKVYQSTSEMIEAYKAVCGPLTPPDGGGTGPGRSLMTTKARFNRG